MRKPATTPDRPAASSSPHPGARHVFIRDLVIITRIGVHDAEKRAPQRIIVNVDLSVREDGPMRSDRIEDVVDYGKVAERIEQICKQGHVNLLETLAERAAESCLADRRVLAVRVRIEKPDVIPNARSVGIEIERRQASP